MRFSLLLFFWTVSYAVVADDWRMVEGEEKIKNDRQAHNRQPYQSPNMSTFIQLERAFEEAFRIDDLTPLTAFYQLTLKRNADQSLSVLKTNENLGWGTMTLNHSAQQALFLQVPHRYYDKWTADVASHWLQTGRVKLAMINSQHRHAGKDNKPPVNSDFTTAPNSPFVAASRAFISSFAEPLILQLHGFSQKKRNSTEAKNADVILSHGTNLPRPYLTKLNQAATCIANQMNLKALIFPQTVRELGGTKNVVGKQLRKKGYFQRFIHIELSAQIRKILRDDSEMSVQLLDCVTGAH